MSVYQPPSQSTRGQFLDAFFILALLFATLFATTYIVKTQAVDGAGGAVTAEVPIAQLPISEVEKQQFQKLVSSGKVDLQTVNAAVAANRPDADRYDFSVLSLMLTAGLIVAYMVFVYAMSFKQYREVIAERFGPPEGRIP